MMMTTQQTSEQQTSEQQTFEQQTFEQQTFEQDPVYWERQSGDMCRKHALNAVMHALTGQKGYFSNTTFFKLCDAFDRAVGHPQGTSHVFVSLSGTRNLLDFALRTHLRRSTCTIPLSLDETSHETPGARYLEARQNCKTALASSEAFDAGFEFSDSHVWALVRHASRGWVRVDSNTGVRPLGDLDTVLRASTGKVMVVAEAAVCNEADLCRKVLHRLAPQVQTVTDGLNEHDVSVWLGRLASFETLCGYHETPDRKLLDFVASYESNPSASTGKWIHAWPEILSRLMSSSE
jgi:hypothetical protein